MKMEFNIINLRETIMVYPFSFSFFKSSPFIFSFYLSGVDKEGEAPLRKVLFLPQLVFVLFFSFYLSGVDKEGLPPYCYLQDRPSCPFGAPDEDENLILSRRERKKGSWIPD